MLTLLFIAVLFVAFTNGANANFKGVASLYGTGTSSFRTTLWWGTLTTFAGSVAALFLAGGMLKTFGGRGLVPDALASTSAFALAVAIGAACTSFLATRLSFPVSTTHALVGALAGAGLASGAGIEWGALGKNFFWPLASSPVIAVAVGAAVFLVLRVARLAPSHRTPMLDALHFLSGGAASFARGLNNTPKMAALLLTAQGLGVHGSICLIAVGIAAGALVDARRVAETLAKKITDMNPGEGFSANLATAVLVTTASFHSLPVSTTHVSVGTLTGIGITTGKAKYRNLLEIATAWVITLPCSACIAAIVVWLLRVVRW